MGCQFQDIRNRIYLCRMNWLWSHQAGHADARQDGAITYARGLASRFRRMDGNVVISSDIIGIVCKETKRRFPFYQRAQSAEYLLPICHYLLSPSQR